MLGVAIALISTINSDKVYNEEKGSTPDASMKNSQVQVVPVSHATAVLLWGDKVIYTDPTGGVEAFAGQPPADIVLLTDIHGDHMEPDTLSAVLGDAALIAPQAVKDELPEELAARVRVLANGESADEAGFRIEAVPMYNIPESTDAYHTKGRGNGYVVEKDGFRVYVAGDTSGTPEMRSLTGIDVALVPMNLPYTMSVEEAADAVLAFKPRQVYPYHYRGPDGLADVERFKQLVDAAGYDIEVVLLDWYARS
ncbi:MAG: MBL fold metallo-hydrolase [Patescibacteria group bacterium]|nr:MBL fold metallo-hydrolase [Patescibacteria group bacterium]